MAKIMDSYSFKVDEREVTFWTTDKEMLDDVCKYIENVLDAGRWRRQLIETTVIRCEEDEI